MSTRKNTPRDSGDRPTIDKKAARRHVELLTGDADAAVTVQWFRDRAGDGFAGTAHGTLDELWPRLLAAQRQGCGVFVMVNEGDGQGRRAKNVTRVRAAFIDLDGTPLPEEFALPPDFIVPSSPGKFHVYWLVEPTTDIAAFPALQARLAAYYGGDPSVTDLPRVLRLAGFLHQKKQPFRTRIIRDDSFGARYSVAELVDAHPCDFKAPKWRDPAERVAEPPGGWCDDDDGDEVARAIAYLTDDAPPAIKGERGDAATYRVACKLRDLGLSPDKATELLLEHFNPRCEPEWESEDLESKVQNAYEYATGDAGALAVDFPDDDPAAVVSDFEAPDRPEPAKLSKVTAETMDSTFSMVNINGKLRILYWGKSAFDHKVRVPEFWTREDFKQALANKFVTQQVRTTNADGETKTADKRMPLADWWLSRRDRYTYDGLVFDAEQEEVSEQDEINLWRGFGVEECQGDWSLMREHIRTIIAAEDTASDDYILRWLAWAVQNPTRPAEVAVAIVSPQKGTGKGFLGRAMCRLFGAHGVHVARRELIVGKFNAHLSMCGFLFGDEALWPGHKDQEGVLKALLTEPTLTIEPKGVNAYTMKNALSVMLASNEKWVIPASGDDRRYAVFEVSEARKQDHVYFGALDKQMRNGGDGAMLHDLRAMDLDGWHPRNDIPQTKALAAQKEESLAPELGWLAGFLDCGVLPFQHHKYADRVQAGALYDHARKNVPGLHHRSDIQISRFLDEWHIGKKTSNGVWRLFPPLGQMRAMWMQRMPWWRAFDKRVTEWSSDYGHEF